MLKTFMLASGLLIAGFSHPGHAYAPVNLTVIKKELRQYHDSGTYIRELTNVANKAKSYIAKRVEENNRLHKKQKLALVLDIDETVLSNYKQLNEHDFGGSAKEINQLIEQGKDTAIKPMLKLYNYARNHQVKVFFVTGRRENERNITAKNLHAEGFNGWQHLYLTPMSYHQKSIVPFKSGTRRSISQKGYTIIASIGDQVSDISGGYAEKGFKLPNPYYFIP